ncbi:MAG: 16S rRNA (cytidine(1402)-2'-O)-methyltransferase [Methylohalobius sp.]|nr:16S rRNA (cytidine(1402)-2'-O)-methyltransferase [Methylohalobius sp.]
MQGCLYVVATPIGNLGDITLRALEILRHVDLIAAEDTRHSRRLLDHYGITTPLVSLHAYNEQGKAPSLLKELQAGRNVALVADAGTPLISDPGFPLVAAAREADIPVIPIPGPCAAIAALSVAGLPTHRFAFEGFLPRTQSARRAHLRRLKAEPRTMVFYETSHRLKSCLEDLAAVFPPKRRLVIAKELTKLNERLISTSVGEAIELFLSNPEWLKGEFVLLVEGANETESEVLTEQQRHVLELLLEECPVRTAVSLAAKITAAPHKTLYRAALSRQKKIETLS